ncbi:MAG: short chain dehydrogenase [Cohaesibacter sp.]|nr:short chain dehydrogenase [Cohaesibacter sp.]
MKAIVIGGTGLVGSEVVHQLRPDHEVISVGRTRGDMQVNIEERASVKALFERTGPVDAIISLAGDGIFGAFDDDTDEAYARVLKSKVMGQVNIARQGHPYLNEGGSITLTSGAVSRHPMPGTAAIALGAGALDAFVGSVALELKDGKRINAISLSLVKESAEKLGWDSANCVPVKRVAQRYLDAAFGHINGQAIAL